MSSKSKFEGIETDYGLLYPTGFIVAMFATADDAQKTAHALTDAQFSDVRLFSNQELSQHVAALQSQQSFIDRVRVELDESKAASDVFLERVKEGNHAVLVRAEDEDAIQRALPILRPYNPGLMEHYEKWTRTTLR